MPATVVNAIKKRFKGVCHDTEVMLRRTRRLYLRWKLAADIADIQNFIGQQKNFRYHQLDEATTNLEELEV